MKLKTLSTALVLFLFSFAITTACFAAEKTPRRIAIVPTVAETRMADPEAIAYCNSALRASLHVPLNGVLNIHDYISSEEIVAALPELSSPDKRYKFTPSRLKEAADQLQADLIIGFVITDADETRSHNWDGDTILYSYVKLSLLGYDRQKDAFIKLQRREFFHDEESPAGSILSLTRAAADDLLKKADFKKDIFPLSEKPENPAK